VSRFATVYLAVVVVLLAGANVPRLVGWHPLVVLSGSMHPALRAGDIVVLSPGGPDHPAAVGDIVAVVSPDKPGGSYLHRVRRRTGPEGLVTRGDANGRDDFPHVADSKVVGRVRLVVPGVGIPYAQLRQGNPWPLIAAVVGCLYALPTRRRPVVPRRRAGARPTVARLLRSGRRPGPVAVGGR